MKRKGEKWIEVLAPDADGRASSDAGLVAPNPAPRKRGKGRGSVTAFQKVKDRIRELLTK